MTCTLYPRDTAQSWIQWVGILGMQYSVEVNGHCGSGKTHVTGITTYHTVNKKSLSNKLLPPFPL
jgi:hypothetical protein